METSDRRDRVLHLLKTRGPASASDLARRLDMTRMGARQHLARLEEDGLVREQPPSSEGRTIGRPAKVWCLTKDGHGRFPTGYAELAVELIANVRDSVGAEAFATLLALRTERAVADYRARLPGNSTPLARRVAALARLRTQEGYMAQSRTQRDGSVLLIENHCPICVAAEMCQSLCASELDVFRASLGKGVEVSREEHLLDGASRCVYRVIAKRSD